jgi:predicted nucleic acid-binding protein
VTTILADTGPLVAFLDRSDHHHEWAKQQFARFTDPLLTCEAVVAEALFLLRRGNISPDALLKLVIRGILVPSFRLADESPAILRLMERYRNVPMSLADACLVRMSENHPGSKVFTLDSDFTIYRKGPRHVIPLIRPE